MAPFRLHHDELRHELPWLLMQNGPVTKYRQPGPLRAGSRDDARPRVSRAALRLPIVELRRPSACGTQGDLELPVYTGSNFGALADSLTDIEVSEESGVLVALDNFSERHRGDLLLEVMASASRWWLLFGRVFCVVVRTDDRQYEGPPLGGTPPIWNRHELFDEHRGL